MPVSRLQTDVGTVAQPGGAPIRLAAVAALTSHRRQSAMPAMDEEAVFVGILVAAIPLAGVILGWLWWTIQRQVRSRRQRPAQHNEPR